jgi:glutathione S-transferase
MNRLIDVNTSVLASSAALWRGTASFRPARLQPERPLELYDIEASPYCRLVREALTEMDLDALIRPCPSGGKLYRPQAQARGGKQQFPLLVDPNTATQLYESADIIEYLGRTYEAPTRATRGLGRRLAVGQSYAASLARAPGRVRGLHARPSRPPAAPLELYSFESSPFSRLVREVLCELELTYLLRNTGKARWEDMGPPWVRARFFPDLPVEGRNRLALRDRAGRVQLPYLIDPNTGVEMFESVAIIDYLEHTYAA